MKYEINFTQRSANHLRAYERYVQRIILDGIEEQLTHMPTTPTTNRKRLSKNEWSDWELRVGKYRVFYDVIADEEQPSVKIKAVGHKEHNVLYIGGLEVKL